MMNRLQWTRDGQGFRAEIEGGHAAMKRDTATGGWRWSVHIGEARVSNIVKTSQQASDEANAALPGVTERAAELQAEADRKAGLLAKIDHVTTEADPDVVSIFAIAAADKENLSWIMDQVRHRTRTPGISKLIDALSRELYKFRTGQR